MKLVPPAGHRPPCGAGRDRAPAGHRPRNRSGPAPAGPGRPLPRPPAPRRLPMPRAGR